MFVVWPFFAFFLPYSIRIYIYFILLCFVMYCSWFFRSILSFSNNFYDNILHYSFNFDSCYLSFATFYSYSPSFLIIFKALVCSFLTLSRPYFSLCSSFNYFCNALSSSSLPWMPRLSYTYSSCLLVRNILFFSCIISICCFLSYIFFSLTA